VKGVQRRGARLPVAVLVTGRVRVHAELGPGKRAAPGDEVRVVVDAAYASAVDPAPAAPPVGPAAAPWRGPADPAAQVAGAR